MISPEKQPNTSFVLFSFVSIQLSSGGMVGASAYLSADQPSFKWPQVCRSRRVRLHLEDHADKKDAGDPGFVLFRVWTLSSSHPLATMAAQEVTLIPETALRPTVNLKAQQAPQAKGSTGPKWATAQSSVPWAGYTLGGTELSGLWPSHAVPLLASP